MIAKYAPSCQRLKPNNPAPAGSRRQQLSAEIRLVAAAGRGSPELPLTKRPRASRAIQRGIRINPLKLLDSASGKQEITGKDRADRQLFPTSAGLPDQGDQHVCSLYVLFKGRNSATPRIIQSERKMEASRPYKRTRQECEPPIERATAEIVPL